MSLSDNKEKQLKDMPIIKSSVFKSEDGKFIVHKTTITHIKPVNYYAEVLKSEPEESSV